MEKEKDAQLAFLDVQLCREDDGSTCVNRKATHIKQHLSFMSHRPMVHKVAEEEKKQVTDALEEQAENDNIPFLLSALCVWRSHSSLSRITDCITAEVERVLHSNHQSCKQECRSPTNY